MNFAGKILAYLGEPDRFSQILLIAGAPPVEKVGAEFKIVINVVLTPEDIRETLATFASHARRSGAGDMGKHGTFAFGIANQGRFKINYLSQRGSDFVSIQRMPHDLPKLESLLASQSQLALVEETVAFPAGGIVIFTGPSPDALTQFIYATLARINDTRNMVVYLLEQHLSYLIKHRNSIIIQVELGTDVPTLTEGIRNGLFLAPDLIYISNPKTADEYAALMCAAQAGALVLVSSIAVNEHHLYSELEKRLQDEFPVLCHFIQKTIIVNSDRSGLITLTEAPRKAQQ